MNINIVDVILYAILALSVISGMYKGFISSGLAMVGFGAAWYGALNLFPWLAKLALQNEAFMRMLDYYLDPSSLFKTASLATTPVADAVSTVGTGSTLLNQAMQELNNLPLMIQSAFKNNVGNQLFKDLPNVSTMADYLGHTIWVSAINVIAFILIFVVCYVVVLLVVNLLNNVFRFPLLRHLDWLFGGLFGLARGVFVVMLLLGVTPLILSMLPFKEVQTLLEASTLAQRLPSNFAVSTIISMAFPTITG
jgi:uncharacterized membrane protein required for colicin V production